MGSKSKRYLVTTETKDVFIVRQRVSPGDRRFCSRCEAEADMLNLDGAVNVSKARSLQIIHMIQAGKIHSDETADGYLLLCLNSLNEAFK
jgi:hypothetical protein